MSKILTQIQDNLLEFGFSSNEVEIIVALTKYGAMTILEISKNTTLARTSVYNYIESLSRKGIITMVIDNYTKKYQVVDPDQIENLLMNKRKQSIQKTSQLLLQIQNTKDQSNEITITKGLENIKKIYSELLNSKDRSSYLVKGGNYYEWINMDLEFFGQFEIQRGVLFKNIRLLLNPSKKLDKTNKIEHAENMKIKILPIQNQIDTTMVLVDKKVIIWEMQPPYQCIIIKNDFLFAMEKQEFEILWGLL
jgi:sugar-specific transcriptional regulator TrmB